MHNNRSYGNSERHQATLAGKRGRPIANSAIGTRIIDPPVDFAGLARSYGVYGEGPIEDPNALRPAFERAVKYIKEKKQPALVDVVTQPR
jgi:thiamine pyrophosphate-dependent acetolactate synthase large subunit-like protein